MVKSAVGIGTLLMEGIGDTIRVSLSGDPVQEVAAGLEILRACRPAEGLCGNYLLSHLRANLHRRGGHRRKGAPCHPPGVRAPLKRGGDGLRGQRPR